MNEYYVDVVVHGAREITEVSSEQSRDAATGAVAIVAAKIQVGGHDGVVLCA